MQDRELVAAIVNGDPDGLAEAYDRYAAPLYTWCRSMLPDPHPPGEAADAVADTFTIATAKLEGLRDPDQLGSWLRAVARNECLRRLGAAGLGAAGLAADAARPASADAARLASEGAVPEVSPPDGLRERVLEAGADNTPTGRADRVSVAHRAGAFGRTGFPKPIITPGPRWWHQVRRRPRVAAGVAAVAVAVVAGGIAVLLIADGTHRAPASTVALGGGNFGTSAAPIAAFSQAGGPSSPSRRPASASGSPSTATSAADGPTARKSAAPGAPRSSAPTRSSPPSSPPPSPSPSPSPSASSSPPPTPGTLQVTPNELVLSAVKGKPASGTFIVRALGGPVSFVVTSPNAKVTVSPRSGSLRVAGSWITVTVTVRSDVAFSARLTVNPGNLVVTVRFSIKA
jgi:DNA-directed RNA polymerase specialized sigma24 family protein